MSYTKHAWVTGETITAEKLNNIEDGVDDVTRQLSDVEENQIPELKNAIGEKITSPSSPTTGAFLVWNGTAWVAQTLATWQGGNY